MTANEIRTELHKLLESPSLKQADIVRATGIDKGRLSRFLRDKGDLSQETRDRLQGFLSSSDDKPLLTDAQQRRLAEKLANKKLVIFVGAGLSRLAAAKDGSKRKLPLWRELAKQVAEDFHFGDADDFADNPIQLFDALIHSAAVDREDLEAAVAGKLDDSEFNLSGAHTLLRQLPLAALVTTNYDCLLDTLYAEGDPSSKKTAVFLEDDYLAPDNFLYKLHGSLKTLEGRAQSLHTLTESDYQNWRDEHPNAFATLKNIFTKYTVLFIGYGLGDAHFTELLKHVRLANPHRARSFAWLWQPSPSKIKLHESRDQMEITPITSAQDYSKGLQELIAALFAHRSEATPHAPPSLAPDEDAAEWGRYFAAMEGLYGNANLEGLYIGQSHSHGRIKIDDIFVEPDLEPLRQPRPDEATKPPNDEDGGKGENRFSLEKPAQKTREKASLSIGHSQLIVIVGDPGQGKSTLLQHYLLTSVNSTNQCLKRAVLEDRELSTPERTFYIRLSFWEDDGGSADVEAFFTFARKQVLDEADVSARAIDHWFRGNVTWLLDGIDEVRDPTRRHDLRRLLEKLALSRPADRWVVTSRPSGYFDAGLGGNWDERQLADLDQPQARDILENWGTILAKIEGLAFPAEKVYEDLRGNSRLDSTLCNPLLLTMVVLFYRTRKELPKDRWDFYDHATKTLAETWLSHRSRGVRMRRTAFNYLHDFLSALALQMMLSGETVIEETVFSRALEKFLRNRGYQGRELDQEIEAFNSAAQNLIGVLVSKGGCRLGFLHLSFQEFYAAREIQEQDLATKSRYLHFWRHPDWKEVWDLFVLSEKKLEKLSLFFKAVRAKRHLIDQYLWHPETRCLRWMGISRHYHGEHQEVSEIVDLLFTHLKKFPEDDHLIYFCEIFSAGFNQWKKSPPSIVIHYYLKAARDKDSEIRLNAIDNLTPHMFIESVRDAIVSALSDPNSLVRNGAACALEKFVHLDQVKIALVDVVSNDPDELVRAAAVYSLSPQIADPTLLNLFEERLYSDASFIVRACAAAALASSAANDAGQVVLLDALQKNIAGVSAAAAQALSTQLNQPKVINALIKSLHSEDSEISSESAQALGSRSASALVRDALLDILGNSRNGLAPHCAAISLSSQTERPEVRNTLLKILTEDGEVSLRSFAAQLLASETNIPEIRDTLLYMLETSTSDIRSASALALTAERDRPTVFEALLKALKNRNPNVQISAAQALELKADNPDVRHNFINMLSNPNPELRYTAITALGSQIHNPTVKETLIKHFFDERDDRNRQLAFVTLSRLKDDNEVSSLVSHHLEEQTVGVSIAVAKNIFSPRTCQFVFRTLLNCTTKVFEKEEHVYLLESIEELIVKELYE